MDWLVGHINNPRPEMILLPGTAFKDESPG
jgi:hypothetical protein